jgi:hypothetical protein
MTSSALDRFRACISADIELERRLAAIEDTGSFAIVAAECASVLGIALTLDEIRGALRPDLLGLGRFDDRPPGGEGRPAGHWLPGAMVSTAGGLAVDWVHFGGQRLTEPFFEDSLRQARHRPINMLLRHRTHLADLVASEANMPDVVPDGLIFHMSRCGSTLVAQMLAAIEDHIVLSEAPPLDGIVQFGHVGAHVPMEERVALLRAMVAALGRSPDGRRRYFIKLDSWHTLTLPLFRRAFPDTPWVFLYRDPVEVLVSHMRMRGLQTVPGAMGDLYGIAGGERMTTERYVAHVLARICEAALAHRDLGQGLFVNYNELPHAVETRILPHFGMAADGAMLAAMTKAAQRNAKTPRLRFERDEAGKRAEAGPALRAATGTILGDVYRRLEAIAGCSAVEAGELASV